MPVKICPSCGAPNGPRKLVCSCGHDFYAHKKKDTSAPKVKSSDFNQPIQSHQSHHDDIRGSMIGGLIIAIPAGECPVALKSVDEESVIDWAEKVRSYHEQRGNRITDEGLLYYSRQFFPTNDPSHRGISPSHQAIRKILTPSE